MVPHPFSQSHDAIQAARPASARPTRVAAVLVAVGLAVVLSACASPGNASNASSGPSARPRSSSSGGCH